MCFEDFVEEFKKTGIGLDFYKTTLEFMITNSCCIESEKRYITVYEYTIGLTHHGKKYELEEKNMFYSDGSERRSTYNLKEVNVFSDIPYSDHIKIFKYGKNFDDDIDKENVVANIFSDTERVEDTIILPNDIITEHIIIFPEKRKILGEDISGFFFFPNCEGIEISMKEYKNEFVNSLDDIIRSHTKAKKEKKINLEPER